MKICFMADAISPHTQRWVKYFVQANHEVTVLSQTVPETPTEGYKVYQIKKGRKFKFFSYYFRIREIKSLLEKIKPDIVHAHYISTYGFMAALAGFRPLVISAWGGDILLDRYDKVSFLLKYRIRKALSSGDLFHSDGVKTKEAMIKFGAPSEKIVTLYFGVDAKRASPEMKDPSLKEKLGIVDKLTIISLRNLNPIYDISTLIKSVPRVVEHNSDARFIILGSGTEEESLKNLAKTLNVSDKIIFTGRVPYQDIPKYLASSDIYVSTSLDDAGLAASTGEAMACELPVIVTEDVDNRDWVTDGENGFIIPVKSPEILSERIITLLDDQNLRKKFGEKNRKIIIERNDYFTEMSKMEKYYKQVFNEKQKSV